MCHRQTQGIPLPLLEYPEEQSLTFGSSALQVFLQLCFKYGVVFILEWLRFLHETLLYLSLLLSQIAHL